MILIKTGSTEATFLFAENPKTNQNNDNDYNGAGAFVPNNNDFGINNQPTTVIAPSVSEPTTDAPSNQGKTDLEYDIDVRSSALNDNRPNQKPLIRT